MFPQLIAIDGPDGSGKSELTNNLAGYLRALGHGVGLITGYYLPSIFHQVLTEAKDGLIQSGSAMHGDVEQTVYTLEWLAKLKAELPGKLAVNDYVLCDRYVLSRFALAALQKSVTSKNILNNAVRDGGIPIPTVNLLLMATPEISHTRIINRAMKEGRVLEVKESPGQLVEMYRCFDEEWKVIPWDTIRVDAKQSSVTVLEETIRYLEV